MNNLKILPSRHRNIYIDLGIWTERVSNSFTGLRPFYRKGKNPFQWTNVSQVHWGCLPNV
jgi:hypothetical protein